MAKKLPVVQNKGVGIMATSNQQVTMVLAKRLDYGMVIKSPEGGINLKVISACFWGTPDFGKVDVVLVDVETSEYFHETYSASQKLVLVSQEN